MVDDRDAQPERGSRRSYRPRRPRPPLERAELVAYNFGSRLFDVDPDRVMAWFVTKNRPDENMTDDDHEAWDKLGFERFWWNAWNGLNDAAADEATDAPT